MKSDPPQPSTRGLIPIGLGLAILGTSGVSVLVLALSKLYVGEYGTAVVEGIAGLVVLGVFFATYGRYLDRLESHTARVDSETLPEESDATDASVDRTSSAVASSSEAAVRNPAPTHVVIGVVGAANGLLIVCAGAIWTRGEALVLNALAGLSLMIASLLVWWFGRPRDSRGNV